MEAAALGGVDGSEHHGSGEDLLQRLPGSYDSRYADLLFEVVTRRYESQKPLLLSTNKAFAGWSEVFPHAACVVTLVDRLIHRAEVIDIEADSYRLKEAKEHNAARTKRRGKKPPPA